MGWEKRKDKKGEEYFSISYWDSEKQKPVRLPKEETFWIKTEQQAEDFLANKKTESSAMAAKIKTKMAWQNKYYDMDEFIEIYKKERIVDAPGNWKNSIYYLEFYVYPFFLDQKNCNNLNNWKLYNEEFREYLKTVKKVKKTGKTDELAYNTKNHCISTLNTFLLCMCKNKKMAKENYEKCDLFEDYLMNKRTIHDIYLDDEVELINNYFRAYEVKVEGRKIKDSRFYDYWVLLRDTGLRVNETRGLSLQDIFKGEITDATFKKALATFSIPCLAYIYLRYQPDFGNNDNDESTDTEDENEENEPEINRRSSIDEIRDSSGAFRKKDLKGKRKKPEDKKARYIPIISEDLFNILKTRRNEQRELMKKKTYGIDKANYVYFADVKPSQFESALRRACKDLKIKYRSPHCIRHTYATKIAGQTLGNFYLSSMILGHEREATTQNYLHLHGLITKSILQNTAVNDDW